MCWPVERKAPSTYAVERKTVMAPRRSARILASLAAPPLPRRAAFLRAVEAISVHGRLRTTTTAIQRRRTTTTASQRRAIQIAANQPPAEDPPVVNRGGINNLNVMALRRSARILASLAAPPWPRRAAFLRAVEAISVHGRLRTTTTAIQRRRTTTTASQRLRTTTTAIQRRRTTTTASQRRAIQIAANQPPAEDPPVVNRGGINNLNVMALRRSARILASLAAPPLPRRAAFLRAVEAISVHGRLRTTTTAIQRRRTTTTAIQRLRTTTTAIQRRRTTTTASQRRAIQIAANQPPAEDPPVVNRGGINNLNVMALRRSARILASLAAPPLPRRAAFLRAVEAISVHGRLRTTTTAIQRRRTTTTAIQRLRTTTTAIQRRRTTTTASQRRAIQIAANQPPAEDPPVVNRGGINNLNVMALRRSARILASLAAPPLPRRAAFLRAVEAISVHGRLRTTTTAIQRRRTTTTASQRRRTTTTASQRRAIQIAANQPPAEDPPVVNRGGINSRGTNRRGTNRREPNRRGTNSLPVQDTAPIVTLLQNPDPQRGTGNHAVMGALAASLQVAGLQIRRTPPPQGAIRRTGARWS
ncbi:uncharacterized protein LOC117186661 [Drosophila miranda]|uniref:uncharacterized protein LOC117186661 n=1 Tax=Drosophila miranda TaxID=7229 RepID=UPI00143F4F23|nr:uncharacterized protein LOC117186661 [Drosophila miranda]